MIQILLFARLAEIAGTRVVSLPIGNQPFTILQAKQALIDRYPNIKDALSASMAAVNQEYATEDKVIGGEDQVAFIPPVSGG